jgi:hypothetical protein
MTIIEVNNKIRDLKQLRRDKKPFVSTDQYRIWTKELKKLYWYRREILKQ